VTVSNVGKSLKQEAWNTYYILYEQNNINGFEVFKFNIGNVPFYFIIHIAFYSRSNLHEVKSKLFCLTG